MPLDKVTFWCSSFPATSEAPQHLDAPLPAFRGAEGEAPGWSEAAKKHPTVLNDLQRRARL